LRPNRHWKDGRFCHPYHPILHQRKSAVQGVRPIKALILTPTRELAVQIVESFEAYGANCGLRTTVVFGGVSQFNQVETLKKGVDILVATPGRLLDLMNQGFIKLQNIEFFVLDEADRMLDMGFVNDVKKVIAKLPTKRQTLFFSATMPGEIQKLADSILTNPAKVEVTPVSSTAEKINQSVFFVEKNNKKDLLLYLLNNKPIKSVLVFSRTKHGADKVVKDLIKSGINAAAIHGNKSQNARQKALNDFKDGKLKVLVATDIAARGIDVDDLGYVINYDLPNEPETYVHRIGRTGRAGASGIAYSFCDYEEKPYLKDIQKLIAKTIPVVENHPHAPKEGAFYVDAAAVKKVAGSAPSSSQAGRAKKNNGKRWGGNNSGSSGNGGGGNRSGGNNRDGNSGGDRSGGSSNSRGGGRW